MLVSFSCPYYATLGSCELIMGALFFTFQIYGDFSGYSDIAIGTAKLFGIRLMRNFNVPYFSRDIAEFWRRWHISLNTWFRDYVYFPLGGSRGSRMLTLRNTLIIFMLSGLWHGANWTYVVWGAYHALLFTPLFIMGTNRRHKDVPAAGRLLPRPAEAMQMLATFAFVVVGWVIFRAESITQAVHYLWRMVSHFSEPWPSHGNTPFIYCGLVLVAEWLQRDKEHALQLPHHGLLRLRAARWMCYLLLTACTFFLMGNQSTFIYFQF